MARESLIEYFPEYVRRRNEPAVASFRGYRVERWTYGHIADEACRMARELESRGMSRGDAVLLWAENSAEWLAVFWGCLLRGAVIVPIDHISTFEFALRVAQTGLLLKGRVDFQEAVIHRFTAAVKNHFNSAEAFDQRLE